MLNIIPENALPVVLSAPATTNGGVTTDYISLKNAHRVYLVAVFTQAVGHATGMDPVQAQAVAGTNVKPITHPVTVWANNDVAASSVLIRQAYGVTYNLAATAKNQLVVMEIDPAGFDVANGFDTLGCTIDDSSQAGNLVTVLAFVVPRYDQSTNFLID
jgi:hypothetical protein